MNGAMRNERRDELSGEMTLQSSIEKLMRRENLTGPACQQALAEMLEPATNPLKIAAFLVLLRAKRETADELSAIIHTLRDHMVIVPTTHAVLDIVGTGGDGFNTVNISTGSAILAASCGIKVAKHGNRSVSSLTGSADVLEALGINIQLTPDQISQSIDQIGIGFCYSPRFHPAMQALRHIRKTLQVPTLFNILGPVLNPARAAHIVLGVHDAALLPIMADVFIQTGHRRSVVVHGMGLDEISCVGLTKIIEVRQGEKIEYVLDPAVFGLAHCNIADLRGGNAQVNAQLLLATFKGKRGALADTLILNTAVALYLYGRYSSIAEGLAHASENLYSGAALTLLNHWSEFSHEQ